MAATFGLERYERKLYPMGARFIDTDRFDVDQPFAERGKTVGFLGWLEVEKRVPLLAEVAAALPEEIRMIFVGEGTYQETLEQQLAEEIDAGQVEVVGWVEYDAVPAQLNRLQLLLLPSKTEGLPTTVLEAMACGTPAYATPVAGVPDVVRDGETGFLMETVDATLIADEITKILDCEELPRISQTSRELIENEYSFEAAVERYRTILVSLSSTD